MINVFVDGEWYAQVETWEQVERMDFTDCSVYFEVEEDEE